MADADAWAQGGDFLQNGAAYINRSVEEMKGDLEYYTKQYVEEGKVRELAERMRIDFGIEGKVENVVCLGLGSLQNARREARRGSWVQLVALRILVEVLGRLPFFLGPIH